MPEEPVVIPAIMLSDHVIREAGTGKLSLIGCFAIWNAPGFPFKAPTFVVTPFLGNFRSRTGTLDITVHIESATRHTLWSASAKINFETKAQTMPPDSLIEIPFRAVGVTYPEAGRYYARIFIDSEEIAQRSFVVQSVTVAGIPPQEKT